MTQDKQLWAAIYDLFRLLFDEVNEEAAYQKLFEKHPVIFTVLGLGAAESFEKSSRNSIPFDSDRNFQPEPDFIGVTFPAENLVVVELKTPFVGAITTARKDGKRAKFKALAQSYISQVTDYVESIRQRSEARDLVQRVLGITKIADYRAIIIYGLIEDNDPNLVSTLAAQSTIPIEVIFYDQLFEMLLDSYSVSRSDCKSRPGWCFVYYLSLPPSQLHERAVIAEYGRGDSDRLCVYLMGDEIVFECVDSNGKCHQLESPLAGSRIHHVRFEFANDLEGSYMSLSVNNEEVDLRIRNSNLNLFPDTAIFTHGADANGKNGAHFYAFTEYNFNRTMDLMDKLHTFWAFEDACSDMSVCLEYKPESFMVRNPAGNLMQEREECKPILRSWPLPNSS